MQTAEIQTKPDTPSPSLVFPRIPSSLNLNPKPQPVLSFFFDLAYFPLVFNSLPSKLSSYKEVLSNKSLQLAASVLHSLMNSHSCQLINSL
jgi:hypothetical protein